jgi:hypothetical protein
MTSASPEKSFIKFFPANVLMAQDAGKSPCRESAPAIIKSGLQGFPSSSIPFRNWIGGKSLKFWYLLRIMGSGISCMEIEEEAGEELFSLCMVTSNLTKNRKIL